MDAGCRDKYLLVHMTTSL